ncbi:MAG: hypothetical protein ACOCSR_04810, partial [Wenzhouxiangella sp.]
AELTEIGERCRAEFEHSGQPSDWAVYLDHVSGDLHCRARLYFSPAAGCLARRLGAKPCNAPSAGIALIAGREV